MVACVEQIARVALGCGFDGEYLWMKGGYRGNQLSMFHERRTAVDKRIEAEQRQHRGPLETANNGLNMLTRLPFMLHQQNHKSPQHQHLHIKNTSM